MKAKLEFDLDDVDDRMAHLRCVKSTDMALVLWEMSLNMRKRVTSGYDEKDDFYRGVDAVFERYNELMQEHNLDPEELIR
jgi:hypothetical protein